MTVALRDVDDVMAKLHVRHEIRYLARVLSAEQILAEAFFADNAHLLRFHTEFLSTPTSVSAVTTSLVLRVDKASYEVGDLTRHRCHPQRWLLPAAALDPVHHRRDDRGQQRPPELGRRLRRPSGDTVARHAGAV